jgi:methylated-DNA-[protein]-cysteine S-methyltransferase
MLREPLPAVVPCHRVVHADDPMGGYRGDPEARRALLAMEAAA